MKISNQILLIASLLLIIFATGCSKSLLPWEMEDSVQIAEEDLGEENIREYEKPDTSQDFGTAEQGMPGDGASGSFVAEPVQEDEPSLPVKEEDIGDVGMFEKPDTSQDFGTAEQGMPGDGASGSFVAEPFVAEPVPDEPFPPVKEEEEVASLPPDFEKPAPRDFGTAEQGMPGDGSTGSYVAEPYVAEPVPDEPSPPVKEEEEVVSLPQKEEEEVIPQPEKEEVRDRLLSYHPTHLLEDIYFAFDRYDLDDRSRAVLDNNLAYMKAHPELKIEIQGHCDERGTNRYNMSLGERRARSTMSYLVSQGIDESQIRTISYGEERPFCFESNEVCWYQNRRAHFLIAGPEGHVDKRP